jgi:alginate O-acetyltransferase complex protein AlgI
MSFNTLTFMVFFAVVYGLYLSPMGWRPKKIMLLLACYVFYGWSNPWGPAVVLLSTLVDYACGLSLGRRTVESERKLVLGISIAVNLGALAFFKYFNFFAENVAAMLAALGMRSDPVRVHVALLIGLSFYTFLKIGYIIDVYKRKIPPAESFVDFALFVCFFPTVMAGPIMRGGEFLPQLQTPRKVDYESVKKGFTSIICGYFLKVAVADNLAASIKLVYDGPGNALPLEAWLATYFFSVQIFCDFAGYTMIARGVGWLMGLTIPENFRAPYIARGFSDFWGRWHISLSRWLRDYIYIPLGGNREGPARTYRNLMVTMLACGLWHGANWTFIVWGGLHGVYLVVERWLRGIPRARGVLESHGLVATVAGIIIVFHLVTVAWVFFWPNPSVMQL